MKTCTKCGCVGPFHKDRTHCDGYASVCVRCRLKYRRDNPRMVLEAKKRYYQKNKPKYREWSKQSLRRHPEIHTSQIHNRRARIKGTGGRFTKTDWQTMKAHYKYTCLRCGKTEPEIHLSLDHVIPLFLGGCHSVDNIQPLCTKCNVKKNIGTVDYRPSSMITGSQLDLFSHSKA